MDISIDKRNGDVCFNESEHKYWNKSTGDVFTSVTTLIGKYSQPFDGEFWSTYKAIERFMGEDFKMLKGGILKNKDLSNKKVEELGLPLEEIEKHRKDILQEWADKNKASLERGNKIHLEQELKYTTKEKCNMKHYGLDNEFIVRSNNFELDVDRGVFPEYLIYFSKYFEKYDITVNLAGQVDLVIKDLNSLFIRDYKTNEKIDTKSYFNTFNKKHQTMLYPLSNLMDCNFYHYTMQMSMYAYMIQCLYPDLDIEKLTIEHHQHNGKVKEYDCDYLKDECERLINEYARQCYIDKLQSRVKPVIF